MDSLLEALNNFLGNFYGMSPQASVYVLMFVLALPLAAVAYFFAGRRPNDVPYKPPTEAVLHGAPRPGAKRILVVDDSLVARAKLSKLFTNEGYVVVVAEDGNDALKKIEGTKIDVVITDLEMPGMDGFRLIASLQGGIETENLPIIAITGHDHLQARVQECAGIYGIFQKPWNDRDLLKRVDGLSSLKFKPR